MMYICVVYFDVLKNITFSMFSIGYGIKSTANDPTQLFGETMYGFA